MAGYFNRSVIEGHELELERYGGVSGVRLFEALASIDTRAVIRLRAASSMAEPRVQRQISVVSLFDLAECLWTDFTSRAATLQSWQAELWGRAGVIVEQGFELDFIESPPKVLALSIGDASVIACLKVRRAAIRDALASSLFVSDEIKIAVFHHNANRLALDNPLLAELGAIEYIVHWLRG
jgi:hypothetical protein